MPGYVQSFDVGAIWFVVDRLTEGVSPLKMYEYLAAGKPVVATPIPACVATPVVSTAAGADAWVTALEAELRPSADGPRRLAAQSASWDRRVATLLGELESRGLRKVPAS